VAVSELEHLPGVEAAVETRASHVDGAGACAYALRASDAEEVLVELLAWAQRSAARLRALEVVPGTLEDVFLEFTGRRAEGLTMRGFPGLLLASTRMLYRAAESLRVGFLTPISFAAVIASIAG
jgi:hypothetical protein